MENNSKIIHYTIALYAGAMIFTACMNLTGSVLNNIMADYNISLNSGGTMTLFQCAGSIAAIIILSRIADHFKKPFFLIFAFTLSALTLFFMSTFPSIVLFMSCYLLFGASLGIADSMSNAVLSDLYQHNLAPMLGIFHAVCGVGAIVLPIGTALIGTSSWRLIYKIVCLVVAVLVVFQISAYAYNKRGVDSFYSASLAVSSRVSAKKFISDKNIWFAVFSMLFFGLSEGGIIAWIVKYNTDMFPDMGPLKWAFGLSSYWIGATISRFAMAVWPFVKQLNPRKVIICGGILSGICLLIGNMSGNYYIFTACVILYGILNGTIIPQIVGLMSKWYPKNTGLGSSFSFVALYAGFALTAVFMGVIASMSGLRIMMMFPAIFIIFSGIIAIPMRKN